MNIFGTKTLGSILAPLAKIQAELEIYSVEQAKAESKSLAEAVLANAAANEARTNRLGADAHAKKFADFLSLAPADTFAQIEPSTTYRPTE